MTYTTTPGTIPHRAVAYMQKQPRGTQISTIVLCDALDISSANFASVMVGAVKAGLMKTEVRIEGRRVTYWSLGDGVPLAISNDPDDVDDWPEPRAPIGIPKVQSNAFQPIGVYTPFRVGEYDDGSMVIESDGGSMHLVPEHAQKLREFVAKRGCVA